jgi:pimeloyl-ACP methyl ester carboxylesterase
VNAKSKSGKNTYTRFAQRRPTSGGTLPRNPNLSTDLHGAGRLAVEAILGVTHITESLHHTITSLSGVLGPSDQHRTKGITGMVYRNIRTVTKTVGNGIAFLLDRPGSIPSKKDATPSHGREALISVLNGVVGDHLVAADNPLAVSMQFRRDGKPLSKESLLEMIQQSDGKIAVMVHGSCMNDLQWNRQGHDHGAALANDLGFMPLYVHYNTGLHISLNGRKLSDLLERTIQQSPKPISLFMVAHSMGGLVSRSACHYGKTSGHTWVNHLRKLVFLGTPHHGAPLEKCGNWIDKLLEINPYSAPFSRLGKIRSCGITDLRYGNVLEEDWKRCDRFNNRGDQRIPVPLPEGVACYAIAASTGKKSKKFGNMFMGDGLVTTSSALGRHKNAEFNLSIPKAHQWIGQNMNHMDLLNYPKVYETIKAWLKSSSNRDCRIANEEPFH